VADSKNGIALVEPLKIPFVFNVEDYIIVKKTGMVTAHARAS
jgi:hypothetical protein